MFRVLHYIYEVYRESSFSKAAQKLFLSQSSLSLTIKRYESEIGVQIFDRSTMPVKLTDAGVIIINEIQKLLAIEQDMQTYLEDYRELKTGSLTIGVPHMFASYLLPRYLAKFLHLYPDIKVNIAESDLHSLQEIILNGDADLLIECHDFDPELFRIYPLFEEHILLAVPANDPINRSNEKALLTAADILADKHVGAACPAISLTPFEKHPFLMLERGYDLHNRGLRFCRESGFEPHVFMYLNQLATVYSLAKQHLGVTFISDTAVKLSNPGNELVYYKIAADNTTRSVNMVHKRKRYISKAAGAFIELALKLDMHDLVSP